MKKKLLTIILSVFMALGCFTANAFADAEYTITIDINGGTLTNGIPEGWADAGSGKYTKNFAANSWAYYGTDWEGYEPNKEGFVFDDWLPEGATYTNNSVLLTANTNVTARFLELLDVVVDLDGGSIDADDIPEGWALVAGETDKYTKQYAEDSYYYSIVNEWENAVPQYNDGRIFVEWDTSTLYKVAKNDQPMKAIAGEPKPVTVDFDGGTVLSADSSWTLVDGTTDKYSKMYPVGYSTNSIYFDILSAFTVKSLNGTKFFKKTYSNVDGRSKVSGDDTTFKANYTPGITITINPAENGIILVNGEQIDSSFDLLIPENSPETVTNGILKITNDAMDDVVIEAYGNSGYTLDYFTVNDETAKSYFYPIAANTTFSAVFKEGAQTYPIWIDGTQLTSDNLSILNDTVSYNPSTKILTLDGANIETTKPAAIYFGTDITIDVKSDSTLICKDEYSQCAVAGVLGDSGYGLAKTFSNAEASLNITGSGKLTIKLPDFNNGSEVTKIGIFAKSLTIDSDIEIICGNLESTYMHTLTFSGIDSKNTTVNDAKLTIQAGNLTNNDYGQLNGYLLKGNLTINNAELALSVGKVECTYTPNYGFSYDKVEFNYGKITASAYSAGQKINLKSTTPITSFSGATDGTTATDLTFTQKDSSVPLVIVSEETVTVDEVLPSDFPTTSTSGWVDNSVSYKMYHDDNKLKVYMSPSVTITLSETTVLTKDGNNYKYTCNEAPYYTLVFKMNGSNLQAIDVTISPTTYTFELYKYTTAPTSAQEGSTEDLEFVTNAVYTNDSDVTVKVDGTTLTLNTDYTLSHGSTHVTLKGDYVKTLAVGSHTIKIGVNGYSDIDSTFTITGSTPVPIPSPIDIPEYQERRIVPNTFA